jgi:hypothetical protein
MTEFPNFDAWHKNHGCTKEELWKIQNCIGALFGFDHPVAIDAAKAWRKALEECTECGEKESDGRCSHCMQWVCDICKEKHDCSPSA